jgi:hypothetical protein
VDSVFPFLVKYEFWIYAALALGAVFAIRSAWIAWSEWRRSVYGLEKELTLQRVRISGAAVILLLLIGLSQFCLVSFVVPFLPGTTFLLTPTADLLQTPVSALEAGAATPEARVPAPAPGTTGCTPGQLMITFPEPGQEIGGSIELIGTVDVQNYGYFKYEYSQQGNEQWTTIGAGNELRHEESLGAWNPTALVPGDYELRLIVTDNLGNLLSPCIVPVRVIAPVPAPP